MTDYYFKNTFVGMVLMKRYRVSDVVPGEFIYKFKKANEREAQEYLQNQK